MEGSMRRMSRMHYWALANVLRDELLFLHEREDNGDISPLEAEVAEAAVANIAGKIADKLAEGNPGFKRDRFRDAALSEIRRRDGDGYERGQS